MNFKKRISSIASGILTVALIASMFASSALAATMQCAAVGDTVINSYTVNGVQEIIRTRNGYSAQATRNTKKLVFNVPGDTTSFSIGVDGMSLNITTFTNVTSSSKQVVIDASTVNSAFVSSNGCFKKGYYEYGASNATSTQPNTLYFNGVLYVDNTADSNKTAGMEYHISAEPGRMYFPYKSRPAGTDNVSSLKLNLTNYTGEYYYVVYWQPDTIPYRFIAAGPTEPPVKEPETAYPIYVSPMKYADEYTPCSCEFGAAQGATTFGGYLPKGAYIFKIYNAVGDRVVANAAYTDENMVNIGNANQTVDFSFNPIKPAAPVKPIIVCPDDPNYPNGPIAPVYTGNPVAATLDGNKIPVTDVVKTPDGSFDLTDDAKKDLSPAAHKLVVTLDDGTKKEVTVWGTNTANDPYSGKGLDGFVARLYRVVLEREPEAAGHKAWVDALKNRVQLADGSG
ncbi:MAG: hypothetical protein MJ108_10910, partial [Saccharofermentans sp.]|nr:hypothetical protein [Saccharofermentans sp.]